MRSSEQRGLIRIMAGGWFDTFTISDGTIYYHQVMSSPGPRQRAKEFSVRSVGGGVTSTLPRILVAHIKWNTMMCTSNLPLLRTQRFTPSSHANFLSAHNREQGSLVCPVWVGGVPSNYSPPPIESLVESGCAHRQGEARRTTLILAS